MKKIYYLQKHPVKIGDVIEHNGYKAIVTEKLIKFNPELFVVENPMKELLDKAKRDYPIGTVINSRYGIQKVLGDNPFIGIGIPGTIQINTDRFTGGATIYTPEYGWAEILPLRFTTEDGVNIYGDMKTYIVYPNDIGDISYYHGPWNGCSEGKGNKYFYHKENALAYIEKHKEKTLRDYEKMLFENDNSMTFSPKSASFSVYGWIKDNEPKLYYTKILQLIADDLNDGWVADSCNQQQDKYYFNYHYKKYTRERCVVYIPQGAVLFKSIKLIEKAKDILGEKIEYI